MENKDQLTTFSLIKNGPVEVKGDFRITGSDGKLIETGKTIYLCRCGGSGNKPFCDGTHNKNGFIS